MEKRSRVVFTVVVAFLSTGILIYMGGYSAVRLLADPTDFVNWWGVCLGVLGFVMGMWLIFAPRYQCNFCGNVAMHKTQCLVCWRPGTPTWDNGEHSTRLS
jgi:hypothetical protein